ncbi:MAG: hypothetical protein IJB94_03135, partial [Clostridia bacterium]|nr:hypothetical protein [Clostridia bacterium]
ANTYAPKKDGGKKPTAPQRGTKKAPQRDAKGAKGVTRTAKSSTRPAKKTGVKPSGHKKKR